MPTSATCHRWLVPLLVPLCSTLLVSCAGTPWGDTFQKALTPDPRLAASPASPAPSAASNSGQTSSQRMAIALPKDFPDTIPRYAQAQLRDVQTNGNATQTLWESAEGGDRILSFYRDQLKAKGWQVQDQPNGLTAELKTQKLSLKTQPQVDLSGSGANTQYLLQYQTGSLANSPADSPANSSNPSQNPSQNPPGTAIQANFGLAGNAQGVKVTPSPNPAAPAQTLPQTQQLIAQLTQLGTLDGFNPNQVITRRQFARWLVATHNRLFDDKAAQQIRVVDRATKPIFADLPSQDPDFATIQSLAEAGFVPSPLAGDSTTVKFQPDQPLTRETLLLWKLPLDLRQPLPPATIQAVKETWGFQDAAKIEGRALKAVLADFQAGDSANIRRAFGYTTLLQPKKPVTQAEAAAALWYFGYQGEGRSAQDGLKLKNAP